MAKVSVLEQFCKSCGLCVHVCPKNVLAISNRANAKGYYVAEVIHPEHCIGCGLCRTMCPDVALAITK